MSDASVARVGGKGRKKGRKMRNERKVAGRAWAEVGFRQD